MIFNLKKLKNLFQNETKVISIENFDQKIESIKKYFRKKRLKKKKKQI